MGVSDKEMTKLSKLHDAVEELTEWYWQYGTQRDAEWRLGSGWIERLYALRGMLDDSMAASLRPATGIWGPSQAGKSSMLTRYIDVANSDNDPQGLESAITWNAQYPARFRGCETTQVALNPYNSGKDATGCVTRYTLRESVEDTKFPVEVKIATRKALIHAMAAGYLTECQRMDDNGEQVVLNAREIDKMLSNPDIIRQTNATAPDREAYELLREVCDVVESLTGLNDSRYMNLGKRWNEVFRTRIMTNTELTGCLANVKSFMAHLLWDNNAVLNAFLDNLLRYHASLVNSTIGNRRVFCTIEAASILISIASYEDMLNPANEKVRGTAAKTRSLSYNIVGDRMLISCGDGQRPLCLADYEFGLFQACVLELVVPMQMKAAMSATFKEFLSKTDFLDFPGVAQEAANDGDKEQTLNLSRMSQNDPAILTRLMKRGRTASIISSYSAQCDIDNFVLTIRAGRPVSNPSQLINGIEQWWRYADPKYDHRKQPPTAPPLPLFLVLTFCAGIVNEVISNNGSVGNGLGGKFEWLQKLGPMASPDIAKIFVTTYKGVRYTGTEILDSNSNAIHDPNHPELQKALAAIYQDGAFKRLFGNEGSDSYESFRQMAISTEGGTDYFFGKVAKSIDTDRKARLLAKRVVMAAQELSTLLEEALPKAEDAGALRHDFLCSFADAIDAAVAAPLSEQAQRYGFDRQSSWVSYLIRSLQSFQEEKMGNGKITDQYLEDLLKGLDNHLPTFGTDWPLAEIGLDSPDTAYRLARYMAERCFNITIEGKSHTISLANCVMGWYSCNSIGTLKTGDNIKHQVATVIENLLWRGYQATGTVIYVGGKKRPGVIVRPPANTGMELRGTEDAIHIIEGYSNASDGSSIWGDSWLQDDNEEDNSANTNSTPEMDAIVNPFVNYVRALAEEAVTGGRRPQPGDDVLADIKSRSCNA